MVHYILKGIGRPKMAILWSGIHPHIVPNLCLLLNTCLFCLTQNYVHLEECSWLDSSGGLLTTVYEKMVVDSAPEFIGFPRSSKDVLLCWTKPIHFYRLITSKRWEYSVKTELSFWLHCPFNINLSYLKPLSHRDPGKYTENVSGSLSRDC